jgi:hypothetical protein
MSEFRATPWFVLSLQNGGMQATSATLPGNGPRECPVCGVLEVV